MIKYLGLYFLSSHVYAQVPLEPNILDFQLLRQNDIVTIVQSQNSYQKLKSISLGRNNSLSFGGSYRFQMEAFINEEFDKSRDQTDHWFLHRAMLHAHLKLSTKFEIFGELNSSLINGKDNLSPVDKDALNINQLFTRYRFSNHWNLLLGRQNMRLGSGRLVDIREGPNVRLSFDMVQLQYQHPHTSILGFYAIPVQQKEGVFDNDSFKTSEMLSALYWTENWTENTHTDIYLLYKKENQKTWNTGTADDNRVSMGLRHFGRWAGFTFNNEFLYQVGTFGDQSIAAWTASFNIEKDVTSFHLFTIGLKTEVISGDANPNDDRLNTFDALYPRGAYFGRVARFGPSNLIDVHPYLETKIGKLDIALDYVAFWRFSTEDGLYNPALVLEYPSENEKRFVGNQLGAIVGYALNTYVGFEIESNIIYPGAFLKQSNQGDTLYHFVFNTEIRF